MSKTSYGLGDTITVTATPNPGWAFSLWQGDASGVCSSASVIAHAHPASQAGEISADIDRTQAFTLDASSSVGGACSVDVVVDGGKEVIASFSKLGYAWSQLAGPTVTLSDVTSAMPTFTVAKGATGVYGFQVVVTSGPGISGQDGTSIRVFAMDLSFVPPSGSVLSVGTEQTVEVTISYSGLPVGSLLHIDLCAAAGDTPDTALVLNTPQDFKISPESKPDPTFKGVYRWLAGSACDLALVGEAQNEQGSVTATIRLTPPSLGVPYNMVIVDAYAFTPSPINLMPAWSLGDRPAPVFQVGP